MTLGAPPQPARIGDQFNATMTLEMDDGAVGDGGVGVPSYSSAGSNIPCVFQEMSSQERLSYGSVTEETLYVVFFGVLTPGGSDIRIRGTGSTYRITIDGIKYAALGGSVLQGDGKQRLALKRVGAIT